MRFKRAISFLVMLTGILSFASGQIKHGFLEDTLLTKTLQRHIMVGLDDCSGGNSTGITMLEIYKSNNAIRLKTLWVSSRPYDLSENKPLLNS